MAYTWQFKQQFAKEFRNYPKNQQDKILEFIEWYELHGLADFTKFPGKITPSWSGLTTVAPVYQFAKGHALWHYHIGIPKYSSDHSKYKTSDWVLHFQWPNKGSHIVLVDVCYHYKSDGTFQQPERPPRRAGMDAACAGAGTAPRLASRDGNRPYGNGRNPAPIATL